MSYRTGDVAAYTLDLPALLQQPLYRTASLREIEMIHGTNEHMTLENLRRMTDFYTRLIATAAG